MGARISLLAFGNVPREGDKALPLAFRNTVLACNRQFKPMALLAQVHAVLVTSRVARVPGRLQRRAATRHRLGSDKIDQPLAQEHLGSQFQQARACRAEVVNAPVLVQFKQQVGNGVECAFQIVAGGAQCLRHAVGQCHGTYPGGGEKPDQSTHHQAQRHAQHGV